MANRPDNDKTRTPADIRAELDAIAPLPQREHTTVLELGRYLAVRAHERWARGLAMDCEPLTLAETGTMMAEFAAAMALYAIAGQRLQPGPELDLGVAELIPEPLRGDGALDVADIIRDAQNDGGEVGSWLYDLLGKADCERIWALAEELDAARKREAKAAEAAVSTDE